MAQRYTVVVGNSLDSFKRRVMGLLKEGWQLAGGVSVASGHSNFQYAQAMFHDDPPPPAPDVDVALDPRVKAVMDFIGISNLEGFTNYTADNLLVDSHVPMRTLMVVREALDEVGLKLKGD
jgi:hypothetical protein